MLFTKKDKKAKKEKKNKKESKKTQKQDKAVKKQPAKKKQKRKSDNLKVNENVLGKGARGLKELFAPASIDRGHPDYIRVGEKYIKSFVLQGYPSQVFIGWLNDLYNYPGDADVALYIEPADERGALDELTKKITQFEAQLQGEQEKGNIRNITRLTSTIQSLYAQRSALEQNYENLFYIQIFINIYADTLEQLDKEAQMLKQRVSGKRMTLMSMDLRQDEGYKSALPFGKCYTDDLYRNFSSSALTACFPFYNSEITHNNGIFLGVNLSTNTPVFVDFYDRSKLNNSNFTVFGTSGSGKTFLVSLLTMRSAIKGIRTVIIDPENEYVTLTRALGGSHIYLAPGSQTSINPFDLEEEDETDDNGNPTGRQVVKIKDKVSDVLNLIAVMARGLDKEQLSLVSMVLNRLYEEFGFTEDPRSLYDKGSGFNPQTGELSHGGVKKRMPQFSDFHDLLEQVAAEQNSESLRSLANSLKIFKKGGVYDMFDCQTSADIDLLNAPIIVFNISQLEESILRPIGMYVALSWTWEKFIKKNPSVKKRIVCDEAWMLVNKSMAGHEYTSAFLDKAARRIRKRNGGLLIASQSFNEFQDSALGKAVLQNASMNVFLKQSATDIDAVQETFKLSDGEKQFLLSSRKGEMLIKMGQESGESSLAFAKSFEHERRLIEKKH